MNAGPKVSQKNIAQSITLPLQACFLPIVHPTAISSPVKRITHNRPSTWPTENMIHQTRQPSSMLQFQCLLSHGRQYWQWTGFIVGTLIIGSYTYSCTVYLDIFLSWPALSISVIWATVALLFDLTRRVNICIPHASVSLWRPWPWCQFSGCPS